MTGGIGYSRSIGYGHVVGKWHILLVLTDTLLFSRSTDTLLGDLAGTRYWAAFSLEQHVLWEVGGAQSFITKIERLRKIDGDALVD